MLTRFVLPCAVKAMSDALSQVAIHTSALAVLVAEQERKLSELTERIALIEAHLSEYGDPDAMPSVDLEGKPIVIR